MHSSHWAASFFAKQRHTFLTILQYKCRNQKNAAMIVELPSKIFQSLLKLIHQQGTCLAGILFLSDPLTPGIEILL